MRTVLWVRASAVALVFILVAVLGPAVAAPQIRLSIVTGGTGGVYFPLGGGLARLISRNIPNVEATAEVTSASVDNMRLIGAKRADLALTLADTAYDAVNGLESFRGNPVPAVTLTPLYDNFNHLVTVEGTGINTIADLRGKRVSVGSPGSGTEVTALRLLQAAGVDPDRDIRKDRLGVAQSVDALRDKKIDAFFWSGGLPTSAVLDLAATPGVRIKLIPLDSVLPALQAKYGKLYFRSTILKEIYPGVMANVPTVGVANLLVVHRDFNTELAYQITKLIFEKRAELAQVHREAANIRLIGAAERSPLPFHPGAARYFRERGVAGF
ncbi:MAG: TAXI family TRAP transporter solute-binding subunit [Armatimonadota bacterium]|nr:TAXI family TRAP transporter solute-binding subunit [Armatimonadota bacterium]MDR7427605.1 TAXI family TRAP transporter solute-binding subunit [Armatimonadota bacterium]MDR7465383.1 TAXI family TRAP transporter solute-binding subunit [Armatimonadota bacterium]MDR7469573.1 TAXI family TRAP transporter solute-binding subunit [Armatimonadota bacterium]MDR7475867.1 TAXI family TRAP transporter solute-binding subunit [Armatimonadota bacterium]